MLRFAVEHFVVGRLLAQSLVVVISDKRVIGIKDAAPRIVGKLASKARLKGEQSEALRKRSDRARVTLV